MIKLIEYFSSLHSHVTHLNYIESALTLLSFKRSIAFIGEARKIHKISYREIYSTFMRTSRQRRVLGGRSFIAPPVGNFVAATRMISTGSKYVLI